MFQSVSLSRRVQIVRLSLTSIFFCANLKPGGRVILEGFFSASNRNRVARQGALIASAPLFVCR